MAITLGADPAEINLNVIRGSTFRKTITVKAGATEETATLVDYTGATAVLDIVEDGNTTNVLHSMSTANGGLILGGVNGTITFYISATDSSAFTWEEGIYESLEITYSNGDIEGFSRGLVLIGNEYTLP